MATSIGKAYATAKTSQKENKQTYEPSVKTPSKENDDK